jgi:hypothetical protein
MLIRALAIVCLAGLVAFTIKNIAPDVRRYVRISRM